MFLLVNPPVSKPCRPVKDGVSLNIPMIFNVASEGLEGAGLFLFFFEAAEFFLRCALQILPLVLHFLGGPKRHPHGIYSSSNFIPNFAFLRVCYAISKFTL